MDNIKIVYIPHWVEKTIAAVSFILVAVGSFASSFSLSETTENVFIVLGFTFLLLYQSRVWWFKNYVEWNKQQIFLKLNGNKGIRLKFKTINSAVLDKNQLFIKLKNEQELDLPISNLNRKNLQEVHLIIMENAIQNL